MRRVAALALLVAPFVVACADSSAPASDGGYVTDVMAGAQPGEGSRTELTVAAASDLRLAMTELQPALETACGARLTVVYGSSGQFARQLAAGAPFDLFLSADTAYTAEVASAGRVAPGGMARYARGRIALLVRSGLPLPDGLEGLANPQYRKISIANSDHAPYGRAAREALERSDIFPAVKDRLVLADSARGSVDYVDSGNADAGVVALALLADHDSSRYRALDPSLHEPLDQAGAVIAGTGAERTARCVLQELLGDAAQVTLRNFGFDPPQGTAP